MDWISGFAGWLGRSSLGSLVYSLVFVKRKRKNPENKRINYIRNKNERNERKEIVLRKNNLHHVQLVKPAFTLFKCSSFHVNELKKAKLFTCSFTQLRFSQLH